jgi:hypothetical protein
MLGVLGEALARSGDTSKGLRMLARSSINLGDSYHDAWCEGEHFRWPTQLMTCSRT